MLLGVTHPESCCLALQWFRGVLASGFWGLPKGTATMAGAGAGLGGCPASPSTGCTTLSSKPQTASRALKQQKKRQSQTLFLQV